MKTRILAAMLFILAAVSTVAGATASTGTWAPLKNEPTDTRRILKEAEIEILASSGTIIVYTLQPVQIKVFTILGRTVSNQTLPQGEHQLRLPQHGVYIVQIGERTCKVAV